MNLRLLAIAILSGIACLGCATPRHAYRTDVRIAPAAAAHQYTVEFKVSETGRGGRESVVLAPKLIVLAGQEGLVLVGDDSQWNAISCTALIREGAKSLDATTDVDVRRHGRSVWHGTQSVSVAKP